MTSIIIGPFTKLRLCAALENYTSHFGNINTLKLGVTKKKKKNWAHQHINISTQQTPLRWQNSNTCKYNLEMHWMVKRKLIFLKFSKNQCLACHWWETPSKKMFTLVFTVLIHYIICLLNAAIVVFCVWFSVHGMCVPLRHEITCWWLGNVLMASSKSWVTVLNSRTGIPAARSCFVRLNTQALAASWTFRVAGWFFIPKTTS